MKKEVKRTITSKRALRYTELASKAIRLNLVSPEERKKYFDAIYALRELSDEYCELTGLNLD